MTIQSKRFLQLSLAGLALAVMAAIAIPAYAQEEDEYEKKGERTGAGTGSAAAASERARAKREAAAGQAQAKEAPKYPEATRPEPPSKTSSKGAKALKDILADYDAQKYSDVMAKTDTLAADPAANGYEKSFAYQVAANAASDAADDGKAIDYYRKALEANGLDNNSHYQVMYNLAVVQYSAEKYADALATVGRFEAETKTQKPEALKLKAALLNNLDRPNEAAALYEKELARNPEDKATLMNAVALYQASDNFEKANTLLLAAQKKGLLTEAKEYRALYIGFINQGKLKEAVALIDDGLAKGALKPSPELANDYQVIAQNAYGEENVAMAIDLFKRAASIAANGEPALNLAKVLSNEGRVAEAQQAARQALDKGVKKPEEAKKILALSGK